MALLDFLGLEDSEYSYSQLLVRNGRSPDGFQVKKIARASSVSLRMEELILSEAFGFYETSKRAS